MTRTHDIIYYDGNCGLCHHSVKRILRAPGSHRFRFSPLQGQHIRDNLTDEQRDSLPDSVVVLRIDGTLLTRSDAALHILDTLGCQYKKWAKLGRLIPRPIRDAGYIAIAALRKTLYRKPSSTCPMMSARCREQFLD